MMNLSLPYQRLRILREQNINSPHLHMKKLLLPVFFLIGISSFAQVNCPTFSRYGGFDRFEITVLGSTVDPYTGLGHVEFTNEPYLIGGEYTDHSFAAGGILKFFADEHIAIRVKGIITQRNVHDVLEVIDTTSGNRTIDDETFKQTLFKIAPGIQWTFFDEHISFYGGVEVPFTFHDDLVQTSYLLNEEPADSVFLETYGTRIFPGGYSAGLGVFAGSQYYFTRMFALGFELSAAFQYTSVGGDIVSSTETFGSGSGTGGSLYNETMTFFRFTPVQGSILLTVRF